MWVPVDPIEVSDSSAPMATVPANLPATPATQYGNEAQTMGTQITHAHHSHPHWATEGTCVPNRALVSCASAVGGRINTLSVHFTLFLLILVHGDVVPTEPPHFFSDCASVPLVLLRPRQPPYAFAHPWPVRCWPLRFSMRVAAGRSVCE